MWRNRFALLFGLLVCLLVVANTIAFSPDGSKLGFSLATPTAASDVWSWGVTDAKLERWTASELGGLDARALV